VTYTIEIEGERSCLVTCASYPDAQHSDDAFVRIRDELIARDLDASIVHGILEQRHYTICVLFLYDRIEDALRLNLSLPWGDEASDYDPPLDFVRALIIRHVAEAQGGRRTIARHYGNGPTCTPTGR
jgi:hypothetical protein